MAELERELVEAYNASRRIANPREICHAPFTNMYFNVIGQGAPCWLTFFEAPAYPEFSIRDMWFGSFYENIRSLIKKKDLSERCRVCERNIRNRLFINPLAAAYDNEYSLKNYPRIMEFELSNQCNLECSMCNGRLSSTVRKNRDNLPAHTSPYDQNFVNQLSEFIPHLKEARFNGGEPFLQKICWDIWEKIANENPDIEITVATNGTVWSRKVEEILNRAKFRINLSLDGITKATYESIRKNSDFDRVIANAKHFSEYCRKNNRIFSVMINPMRVNWQEMPGLVEFCNKNGYYLWFNTVYRPFNLALWTLPSSELRQVHETLKNYVFKEVKQEFHQIAEGNIRKFKNLVHGQIATWEMEQREREARGTDEASRQQLLRLAKEKLKSRFDERAVEPATSSAAWQKLEALQTKVGQNIQENELFHLLSELPFDWLIYDLEHKSLDMMAQEIYARSEYY